ncbi:DUF4231 domain-containing protein [Nocardia sp. NPDC050412]|uniref:DUF4231 domain-containing protein n=1 Tax=Nocardia sp. NPDC050412 TaxID=3364320 RepID=UPI0037BD5016
MTVASDDELVNALWERRIRWSHAATRMKLRIDRLRLTVLYLSSWGAIAAALTATVLRQSGLSSRIVAATGAAALAGATYVGAQLLTSEAVRRWTRARAVSEGMRQQIFRFRAIPGTVAQLRAEVEELEQAAEDLLCFLEEAPPVGPAPGPLTPEQYASKRVEGQITNYYRPTARRYCARAQFLRRVAIALGLIATMAASVSTAVSADAATRIAPWIAVLTTLSGALVAYLASKRYDFLVVSYLATANRLQRLLDHWRTAGSPTDPPQWSEFVDDCENTIAVENESWLAKWADAR